MITPTIQQCEQEIVTVWKLNSELKTYNEKQEKRIAELEKERDEAVFLAEQRRQFIVNGVELGYIPHPTIEEDKAANLTILMCGFDNSHAMKAHDLRQRAKGVENAKEYYSHKWDDEVEKVTVSIMKKGMGYIYPEGLGEYSKILRNEAKALQGQG
jgi:hypothetical protein